MRHKYWKEQAKLDTLSREIDECYNSIEVSQLSISNAQKSLDNHTMDIDDYKLFKEANNSRIKNLKRKLRLCKIKKFFKSIKIKLLYGKYLNEQDDE